MKRVYSGRNEVEAHFVRNALEAEGIEAVVQGETLAAGAVPMLSGESQPSVYVAEADEARATDVVRSLPQPTAPAGDADIDRAATGPTWACPKCGERVEAQFDACWNCGAARE